MFMLAPDCRAALAASIFSSLSASKSALSALESSTSSSQHTKLAQKKRVHRSRNNHLMVAAVIVLEPLMLDDQNGMWMA